MKTLNRDETERELSHGDDRTDSSALNTKQLIQSVLQPVTSNVF